MVNIVLTISFRVCHCLSISDKFFDVYVNVVINRILLSDKYALMSWLFTTNSLSVAATQILHLLDANAATTSFSLINVSDLLFNPFTKIFPVATSTTPNIYVSRVSTDKAGNGLRSNRIQSPGLVAFPMILWSSYDTYSLDFVCRCFCNAHSLQFVIPPTRLVEYPGRSPRLAIKLSLVGAIWPNDSWYLQVVTLSWNWSTHFWPKW